ncbi:HDIG domain-containing metalloprotein [Albibacterium sp. RHL897]|uniref:HDIG domain-containing metalloprotein n=2 Tax=Albibacterium profundi TaxID=3134906 RepID=A0ABV5CFH5_9SPHI
MSKKKTNKNKFLEQNPQLFRYALMFFCVAIIAIFLPKHPRFRFEFEKGKVWLNEDLVSPYNFAILKTAEELAADRDQILQSINPIYEFQSKVGPDQISRMQADLTTKWANTTFDPDDEQFYYEVATDILTKIYADGVMSPTKKFQIDDNHYNFTLLRDKISTVKNTVDVFTQETAFAYADEIIKKSNRIEHKEWLKRIVLDHIQNNFVYNEQLTNKLEADALANISTTRGMVQKGELIIAEGATIDNEAYQKIESLRNAYEEEARIGGDIKVVILGQVLIVGMIVFLLMAFLFLFRKDIYNDNRLLGLILLVITSMLVLLSWAVSIKLPNLYLIPFCIVPIIIRILFDTRMALNIHLLMVLVAAYFVPNSFEFVFLQLTAGMVAIYSIKTLIKREQFLLSALFILATYVVAYLGMVLIRNGNVDDVRWLDFVPFIVSVILTLLAYPLIYAFERFFGITSDVTLMELTNTNSKLLREMSYKAPGTFQHSLQVANLAEAAIYQIGGNSLLIRAGALYHDIGKTLNPQYFIENQTKGYNPHDGLTFEQSAQIIISHVSKGIEMARKANLPEEIIDFIKTHHGTTRVDYFYQSYIKTFPEKFVDEDLFHYPGPIPFSKETAVLMLADSVEAASKSIKEPDAKSISNLVDKIIDYKLEQEQLKNSDITLQEVEKIREIFKNMLMSIYHVRVDYDIKKDKKTESQPTGN